VIVTIPSQISTAPSGYYVSLTDLAHAPIPTVGNFGAWLTGLFNNNVTQWAAGPILLATAWAVLSLATTPLYRHTSRIAAEAKVSSGPSSPSTPRS